MTRIVGSTNNSEYFRIVGDASHATPGEPVTGLLFSDFETGGSASYLRQGSARVDLTLITLASASAAHADGGFIEVDATNMPGVYRCDFPDAAYLSGVQQIIFSLVAANANNAISIPVTHDLIVFDLNVAQQNVNIAQISGNSVSADGLRDTYNGTGFVDDNAPATQSQIAGITNSGSAVSIIADSYILTTGAQSSGTILNTQALDGVYHQHTDAAGSLDLYYEFLIGSGSPSSVTVNGRLNGGNDDLEVYCYDWSQAAYVQIGAFTGTNGTSDKVETYPLTVTMVGSGNDLGKVRVRFFDGAFSLTSAQLFIDRILCGFNRGAEGYEHAAVWYDDTAGNTNTVGGVDGTPRQEVSTEGAVETLLTSQSLRRVEISPGSTYAITSSHANRILTGHGSTLTLGGQDISNCSFYNFINVSGSSSGALEPIFYDSKIKIVTVPASNFMGCSFESTLTMGAAGDFDFIDCRSYENAIPIFTKTLGQEIHCDFVNWSGSLIISNLQTNDTIDISGSSVCDIVLNGVDGAVNICGIYKSVTDNRTGSPVLDLGGAILASDILSILTDTEITLEGHLTDIKGASFNAATDSNEAIRNRGDTAWTTGAGGTPPDLLQSTTIGTLTNQTSFTLVAGSADDSAYAGQIAIITDSTTSEQKAVADVSAYSGATKTITLTADPAVFTMSAGDNIDIIAVTGAGGSGASAADVWSYNNRALTDKAGFAISGIKQTLDDLNDIPATSIVTGGAIATSSGAVVNVDSVDVTSINTDMRGTDNAATSANLSNAQDDLNIITGSDGVTLASLQGNYAPNVVVPDPAGTAPTAIEIRAEIDANSTNLDSIIATLGVAGAGLTDLGGMSTGMQTEVLAEMNKIFSTQMAEAYAADGTVPTLEQCLMLIQQSIMEFAINGSLITIKQLDGVTTAAVVTMDSGTAPVTSRSRTS